MNSDFRNISGFNGISEDSARFKMFKSGKQWMIASLVGLSVLGVGTAANADQVAVVHQPAVTHVQMKPAPATPVVKAAPTSTATPTPTSRATSVSSGAPAQSTAQTSTTPVASSAPVATPTPASVAAPTSTPTSTATVNSVAVASTAPTETQSAAAQNVNTVQNVNVTATTPAGQAQGLNELNAVRASVRNYPYQYEDSGQPLAALNLNSDLNAWAQTRANELAGIGAISHTDMANGRPGWVTPTNLLNSPSYVSGTIGHGPESLYMQKTKTGSGSYIPLGEANAIQGAVKFWTDEASNNYDHAGHYLTEVSPLANLVGFAYAYNAQTGAEIVVFELAYAKQAAISAQKYVTRAPQTSVPLRNPNVAVSLGTQTQPIQSKAVVLATTPTNYGNATAVANRNATDKASLKAHASVAAKTHAGRTESATKRSTAVAVHDGTAKVKGVLKTATAHLPKTTERTGVNAIVVGIATALLMGMVGVYLALKRAAKKARKF